MCFLAIGGVLGAVLVVLFVGELHELVLLSEEVFDVLKLDIHEIHVLYPTNRE